MRRYYKSVKYTVIGGYVVLTALLLVSLWLVLSQTSQLHTIDNTDVELHRKRRCAAEAFTALYRVELIGQTLDMTRPQDYMAYSATVGEALAAVDSLKTLVTDSVQIQRADSIHLLLLEKARNMRRFISATATEDARKDARLAAMLAHQDTLLAIRSEQYRLMASSDSLAVREQGNGFWSRLSRAFSGSRRYRQQHDSLQQAVDQLTIYSDTLAARLQAIEQSYVSDRDSAMTALAGHRMRLERDNRLLSLHIHRLIHDYEQELALRIEEHIAMNESVRRRVTDTSLYIAIAAILIALAFGAVITFILGRNNRYKNELEEAHRRTAALLEAREKMMIAITHDFKAPLGSIMGYINLLQRLAPGERQQLYLDSMNLSSQHLLALVNSLLDFYRLDSDKMTVQRVAFNPYELFHSEVLQYRPVALEKGLCLHNVWNSDERLCLSDPLKIRQIVENLLGNAIKFTTGGSVVVRLAVTDDEMAFSVTDTGCGMEQAECERIFDEFTRLSGAQGKEGFGLGLSITRKLVHLLGGTISVESTPGKGSTFYVRLPIEPVTHETPVATDERPFEGVRALLLDDDDLQLTMFAAQLQLLGVQPTGCNNAHDALSHLQHEAYDIFFTDLQMPGEDGFAIVSRLRNATDERLQLLPVVAVSARSDMNSDILLQHGFAARLEKPFSQTALCNVLADVLGREPLDAPAVPAANETTVDAPYNFAALTAFACGDAPACRNILTTCAGELDEQSTAMHNALTAGDTCTLRAIAHKWVPLFTMLGAQALVPALRRVEHNDNDAPLAADVEAILAEAQNIIDALNQHIQDSDL